MQVSIRRSIIIGIMSLSFGLPGPSAAPAQELTAAQRLKISEEILQRNRDLIAAWEQPDAHDAWMELYVSDKHPSWAKGQSHLVINGKDFGTRAEMEALFRPMLANRSTKVTMKNEHVAVLTADQAIHFADFTYSVTEGGKTTEEYTAAATTIWVREAGRWKILHYHQSWPCQTPVPAASAH